jgi:hypothetical protein
VYVPNKGDFDMSNENLLTTEQAMARLNMSRGTFFSRIKERKIKPSNYNPALKKQHRPLFRQEDIDKLAEVSDEDKPGYAA